MPNLTLYRHPLSGHSHRVELLLSLLDLQVDVVDIDLMNGEQKSPEFLAKNPAGQVPVLEVDGQPIADSNAILVYLATRFDGTNTWLPTDPQSVAAVQRALTQAAGPLAQGPATARLITLFGAPYDAATTLIAAHRYLESLEERLSQHHWAATDQPTIADVALYAYVAHAPEGNVSLADYPAIRLWLNRIEALPGFVPMQKSTVGLAA
ncbi:MAG: glutathione S-transferase [Pseudomonadales bacterium]